MSFISEQTSPASILRPHRPGCTCAPCRALQQASVGEAAPSRASRPGRWLAVPRRIILVVAHHRVPIAIASLVWLIWRSGTQPRRLGYPCQQAASANLGALAVAIVPALARRKNRRADAASPWRRRAHLAAGTVALSGILFILVSTGTGVYSSLVQPYSTFTPALQPWTRMGAQDLTTAVELPLAPLVPGNSQAVVAVERNNAAAYGAAPYGPGTNTAYELVVRAVQDLKLGPTGNPLANLIRPGDKVVIKPNLVLYFADADGERSPSYTHPAMIRPLIDLACLAGASRITVADGSGSVLTDKMDRMGYTAGYFAQLSALHPGVTITRYDFQNLSRWSWVSLGAGAGGASTYAGSGYKSYELVKGQGTYATYFNTPDNKSLTPNASTSDVVGWYALNDEMLEANVIIDVPKMKVHYLSPNTMALKNWVGTTMFSTYDSSTQYYARISHMKEGAANYDQCFGNDILWREVIDLHRAFLYWKDAVVHSIPQRRYLCVLDAINAGETRIQGSTGPTHFPVKTVVASVDPVATDAVGSRLMRFDSNYIPIINNANAPSNWPIGTSDPAKVRLVGSTSIDASYGHRFIHDRSLDSNLSWGDWVALQINDLTPPAIQNASAHQLRSGGWVVEAAIDDAHVAFLYYTDGQGVEHAVRLARNGSSFSAGITDSISTARIVAQDAMFNSAARDVAVADGAFIRATPAAIEHRVHFSDTFAPDVLAIRNDGVGTMNFAVTANQPWITVVPNSGTSVDTDASVEVRYQFVAGTDLHVGPNTAQLVVSSSEAGNSPLIVPVTIVLETVAGDFDGDGDVDQTDFAHMQVCQTGNTVAPSDACRDADLLGDDDVDVDDARVLMGCMSGAGVIADKACDD